MPRDWKGPFNRRLQVRASERGKRMADARWAKDRARREALVALTPDRYQARIVKRIVVVFDERIVKETTIWNWESLASARRKEKKALCY